MEVSGNGLEKSAVAYNEGWPQRLIIDCTQNAIEGSPDKRIAGLSPRWFEHLPRPSQSKRFRVQRLDVFDR